MKRVPLLIAGAVGVAAAWLVASAAQQVRNEAASKREPTVITLPAGTELQVQLDSTLHTMHTRSGDPFAATLYAPVVDADRVVLPKGVRLHGRVTNASPSGRLRGRGHLALTLDSLALDGKSYRITTFERSRSTTSHRKRNLAWIAGGSGGGALLGGLAGGGPWALAGAGIGAASGTAAAALTGRKHVSFPAESLVIFKLKAPVAVPRRS